MADAPIISIFRATGGPPVARGVLVAGANGTAGLFRPWPEVLTKKVEFGVHVPESDGIRAQWLTPSEVWTVKFRNEPSLGAVAFTQQPAHMGSIETIDQAEFDSIWRGRGGSRWAALKAARANDLKTLRELGGSAENLTPPHGIAGKPQMMTERSVSLAGGICRWLLRWD